MLDILVGTFLLMGAALNVCMRALARRKGRSNAWPPGLRWLTVVFCLQGPAMIWRGWTGRPVPFDTWLFVILNFLFAAMLLEMVVAYRRRSASH